MNKIIYWNDPDCNSIITPLLRSNHVIACDSDTVGGLTSQPTASAFKTLNSIKKRECKPYLLLIGSKERLKDYVDDKQLLQIEKIAGHCWPGPLTLILRAKKGVPDFLQSAQGTIAFRVPDHKGLLDLLQHFPALFSTSANLADNPTPVSVLDIDSEIKKQVKAVVADKQKKMTVGLPSTILDCSGDQIKVVREGAYPIKELKKFVELIL